MGKKNYLVDGLSGTGKTTVAEELERRGYHVVHGDRVLAYQGDPDTGQALETPTHLDADELTLWQAKHWIWDLDKVQNIISDDSTEVSFLCGGSRNLNKFKGLLDDIFVLDVADLDILHRRIAERIAMDPTDWGGKPEEKVLLARLHNTKETIPKDGILIDATFPVVDVVDAILENCS